MSFNEGPGHGVSAGDDLHAGLAGEVWQDLPKAFRDVHAPGNATGTLDVARGPSILARALAWICRLPRAGRGTPLALRVERDGASQVWRRRFGDRQFVTRQFARDGLLRERFGLLELTFRLLATRQSLRFEQQAAALVLGPVRLPWPRPLAPRVAAEARPLEAGAAIEVEIRAPLAGLLLRYAGSVHPGDTR